MVVLFVLVRVDWAMVGESELLGYRGLRGVRDPRVKSGLERTGAAGNTVGVRGTAIKVRQWRERANVER